MKNNFCVLIISHGRYDNIITLDILKKCNCTYPVYIVIDNEDKTAREYKEKYKEMVVEFDKLKYANMTDEGDNFDNRRSTTHARNACFDIAKNLGYKYFVVLDDDYNRFAYTLNKNGGYGKAQIVLNIDKIFDIYIEFLITTKALSVAFVQGGDFMGGKESNLLKTGLKRKCMNAWFCDVDKPFKFFSRLNEDVNTYLVLGQKGHLFFTPIQIRLEQSRTQATAGGMTEAYIDNGTYVKSFYSVMYAPSYVKIALMGRSAKRLHHFVSWKKAVPCIIDEQYKKL
jgi:hypothetical protein